MQTLMFLLKKYFLKFLKRSRLISKINFCLSRNHNEKKIIIPFINGIGLPNFLLKRNFLDILISVFGDEKKGAFVDVGVNIGQSLIRVKTTLPDIEYLGFEPNASCVSYSQELIRKNKFKSCKILNCALSENVQILELNKTFSDDVRASIIAQLRPNAFSRVEDVLSLDFDLPFSNQSISFIKIDVEGAEFDVLKGMERSIRKYQPIITCEVLDSHNTETLDFSSNRANMLGDFLHSMDYGIIQLQTMNSGIISYNKIQSFEIKLWTPESYSYNDYLFFPKAQLHNVEASLKSSLINNKEGN